MADTLRNALASIALVARESSSTDAQKVRTMHRIANKALREDDAAPCVSGADPEHLRSFREHYALKPWDLTYAPPEQRARGVAFADPGTELRWQGWRYGCVVSDFIEGK